MEIAELKAEKREIAGKESSKKLRRDGRVPAIVYSGGKATEISVNAREFSALTHSDAGKNVIVKLKIPGVKKAPNAIIKEVQRNPIKNEYFHVDFQEIAMDELIQAMIPVVHVGDAAGIKLGGILERHLDQLEIEGLPGAMPDHLDIDITDMQIGDSIHAKDVQLPGDMAMLTDPDAVLLTIAAAAAAEVETTAVESIEPAVVAGGGEAAASEEG
ncbi:MAG TPA: 50S ribosomal protein L25 [Candidatus Aquicultor sp.]|jgi:large subunit ribosomal protein L25